jgi:hypothetical protein
MNGDSLEEKNAALEAELEERRRWQHQWDEIPVAETELYGKVLAPRSPDQLMLVLGQLAAVGVGAWRGHADATWKLDSSLARRWQRHRAYLGPAYPLDEARLRRLETEVIEAARRAGFLEPVADLELLARLQHHGAATRLLDCTRNAFVALWFACRELTDDAGVLVGFRLSEDRALQLSSAMLHDDLEALLAIANGRLLWWRPRTLSPRIAAQQAVFVFSETVEKPWGSVNLTGKTDIGGVGDIPGLVTLLVSSELKASLNGGWEEIFGYTEESLFPDFDGFAQSHSIANPFPVGFPL